MTDNQHDVKIIRILLLKGWNKRQITMFFNAFSNLQPKTIEKLIRTALEGS